MDQSCGPLEVSASQRRAVYLPIYRNKMPSLPKPQEVDETLVRHFHNLHTAELSVLLTSLILQTICKQLSQLHHPSCEKYSPLFFLGHPLFQVHAECIRDSVDVVEVGDHLHGVMNGRVGKSLSAQQIEISGRHMGRP